MVEVPTGHRTSPEMATPRDGTKGPGGVSAVEVGRRLIMVASSDQGHCGWSDGP